jgi:hypothetical protein
MAQLVKTMAGLAIASVKTVNGLAIASVKTVAGLDNTSGGGPPFSYDFTGADLSAWDSAKFTTLSGLGAPNIVSNQGNFPTGSFSGMGVTYTGGNTNTVNQYQRFTITFASLSFFQIIFRYTNSSSPFYVLEFDPTNGTFVWQRFANLAAFIAGTGTDIQTDNTIAGWTNGDTVSCLVNGTTTSTEVNIWRNATGNAPTSAVLWGGSAPGASMTNNPASPVDTGNVLGIAATQNTANSTKLDTWFGGDV